MSQTVDLLVINARVFTADPTRPSAEAVAVQGNKIAFVGSNADAATWRGPRTRVIDAGGGTLMPGFIDSHFHLFLGAYKLGDIELDKAESLAEISAAIHQFAAAQPHSDEAWLKGQGIHYAALPNNTLTRRQLDDIVADRPLILIAYDGHTAWANTEALRRANILTADRPVGPNSEIKRETDGNAAGELVEPGAYNLVLDCIPPLTEARQKKLLKQGLNWLASLGVTSVHNMLGDAAQMALLQSLEKAGDLTLRVYIPYYVTPETPLEALAEGARMRAASTPLVRGGAVKFFMDGVIETFTGLLVDDYAGRPGDKGGALFKAEHFTRFAAEADRLGLQIFVHAVGDGAVRRTLDGFEAAQQTNGRRDSRHRVEHIEVIHPGDLPRFAQLGVIASMQPAHAMLTADDPDPWLKHIDPGRWACSFAWQTIREARARLAFGSDWPVASPDPLVGLHYALNRQSWAADVPSQRQSLADTLVSYTHDAAYAEFEEQRKGRLAPGMLADLVLLSANLFSTPPEAITQVRPVLTLVNGRIVFEA